jgi:hypothetical protein
MAAVLLNNATLSYYKERLLNLQPGTQPHWGALDATRLLRHLTKTIEISLGETTDDLTPVVPRVMQPFFYLFAFRLFTNWPKAKLKAPEYFLPQPKAEFAQEREELIEALERFVTALKTTPDRRGYSPLLGDIPLTRWSRVHAVHFDHHFRQFGLV